MKYNGYMTEKDVSFFDLFDPKQPRSGDDLAKERLAICQECPFFKKTAKRCGKCGCFMSLKSLLYKAKCPVGRW